jgi:hypothetical protein
MRYLLLSTAYIMLPLGVIADVRLVKGKVLREDLSPFPTPSNLVVLARRPGDPNPIAAKINGSSYELVVPADKANHASIWTIEFHEDSRYPGVVERISGPSNADAPKGWVHQIDKVLTLELFRHVPPGDAPRGYADNIAQLLDYENLWYEGIGDGMSEEQLRSLYREQILSLPNIQDRVHIPEIFPPDSKYLVRRQLLWNKRREVFRLYNLRMPENDHCEHPPTKVPRR